MRAALRELPSPHPFGTSMPALYQEDEFTQRWLAGFDEVIAPIFCTLDNVHQYFDPDLAPDDFVEWLAGWVGLAVEDTWTPEALRRVVKQAVELYRWRGTVRGLATMVAAYAGVEPEIIDSGGSTWSMRPGGVAPGDGTYTVLVRVRGSSIDGRRLERLIALAKPVHVNHRVEMS
jgi:phage tail-like protein